jgi:hypothetical protein
MVPSNELPVVSVKSPTEFSVVAVFPVIVEPVSTSFPLKRIVKTAEIEAVFPVNWQLELVTVEESEMYKQADCTAWLPVKLVSVIVTFDKLTTFKAAMFA